MNTETNTQPLPQATCSDASVIVANGYYRLKAENEHLLRLVNDLYRLVVNHHSSTVMIEKIVICPICTSRTGKRILDQAWAAMHPNEKAHAPLPAASVERQGNDETK